MTAKFYPYLLHFKQASGTSRGVLHTKETFFLELFEGENKGIGECGLFRGLSCDDIPEYEEKLQWLCENINQDFDVLKEELRHFPSIWFGYEQALLNLQHGRDLYFPSAFTEGKSSIKINGLIWMGSVDFMQQQITEKLNQGFDCIKLKIGVDWNSERQILTQLRQQFPANILEIRVDANGGFTYDEAKVVLQELADLSIHSIEQPIKKNRESRIENREPRFERQESENDKRQTINDKLETRTERREPSDENQEPRFERQESENDKRQTINENRETRTENRESRFESQESINYKRQTTNDISKLCANTPTPIALDEELIGVNYFEEKKQLLKNIRPQYIILKPSLVGGFTGCDEWISIAEHLGIGWWITSALESNIGLNAIAQYTYTKKNPMPQGLGTGSLFTNNLDSPIKLMGDQMWFGK